MGRTRSGEDADPGVLLLLGSNMRLVWSVSVRGVEWREGGKRSKISQCGVALGEGVRLTDGGEARRNEGLKEQQEDTTLL